MTPAIAEREAVDGQPIRPDRPERLEQGFEDDRRGQPAVLGAVHEGVVQAAGPGIVGAGEEIGPIGGLPPEPAKQGGAAVEPEQHIVLACLEAERQYGLVEPGEDGRVGAEPVPPLRRESARFEHSLARHRQPFGAAQESEGGGVAILPAWSRAGIEKHRQDDEVEGGPCPRARVCAVRQSRFAGDEVAPARVERDGEIGIALPGHFGGELGGVGEPAEIDHPSLDLARKSALEHLMRAFADGGGAEQSPDR